VVEERGFFEGESMRARLWVLDTIVTSLVDDDDAGTERSPRSDCSSTPLRNQPPQERQVLGVCHK